MGLFSRRRATTDAGAAIGAFWQWWVAEGADAVAGAIADREPGRIVEALSARVDAVHDGLAWELGPGGQESQHVLVVTAAGDPALRPLARRWRLAAPPADAVWSYADMRQPTADAGAVSLEIEGQHVDLARATAGARVVGAAVDVSVHHPAWADLEPQMRTQAAFLLLDTVLGEAAVETWLGEVSAAELEPLDAVPLTGLRSVVCSLEEQHLDADGEPTWAVLEGTGPTGRPVLAMTQVPLRAATAPHLDTHVAVVVPFTDTTEQGLPGAQSLPRLRSLEEHLIDRVGPSGRLVAHESHDGVRVLHLYVDGTTPAAEQVRAAVPGWDQGRVQVASQLDPAWAAVAHLRA
ncbi:DUF695 domain-containing protein [Oryzihumus leptocrescens]|uniref:Uncharacterized protein DUF695 n=1 Tax=Oryzihumus leptocrescens TaxID=297536 RepID=A0A542ZFT2_9MICO|nr:DUF695 domain-containing protein [Oryzihumus leptocrescens]TQL59090.1 uncharacterized protein DUF695 [Oryzihumus leptocrescens]